MDNKKILIDKLYNFFNMFGDKKYIMISYMLDHNVFTNDFINNILNNKKFDNIIDVPQFDKMENILPFYNTILDNFEDCGDTIEEITLNLNNKMDEYIYKDMFEEAIRLRDYMKKNKIERIIK